jgi:7-carboxy-7-deazaguanine synthase
MSLRLVEEFVSIQGEGPNTGRRAYFIRTAGCNLRCSWCDTPFTWKAKGEGTYDATADELIRNISEAKVGVVVVTGGEPMLQWKRQDFNQLITYCACTGTILQIETNGTILPDLDTPNVHLMTFTVSPKVKSAGIEDSDVDYKKWIGLRLKTHWKFVVRTSSDFETDLLEVEEIVVKYGLNRQVVWIMLEGTEHKKQFLNMTPESIDIIVQDHQFNYAARVHTLIWGDKRGK